MFAVEPWRGSAVVICRSLGKVGIMTKKLFVIVLVFSSLVACGVEPAGDESAPGEATSPELDKSISPLSPPPPTQECYTEIECEPCGDNQTRSVFYQYCPDVPRRRLRDRPCGEFCIPG
jgi:hypothetical protein